MIIDKIEHYTHYPFGAAWEKAFAFLKSVTPQTENKKYTIQGDDIYAIVMSYETADPAGALFESHERYVDIQTAIVGCERFECAFRDNLRVHTPYAPQTDAQLYTRDIAAPVQVDVGVGTFVMLSPHDAHLAGVMIDALPKRVKKVVVKVKKELLEIKG